MQTWELLKEKRGEFGPWLRRVFWLPLRGMLRMFHVLPVCAALLVFVLLATDGQLREIYVSYMEALGSGDLLAPAFRLVVAAFAFALVSSILYQAHHALSTQRIVAVYSSTADLNSGARLRGVREGAAVVLALAPWLGLFAGLLNAKVYLAYLFTQLQDAGATDLGQMQQVPMPGPLAITAGILVLGLVLSLVVAASPKRRGLQRSVIVATPPTAALLFLLLVTSPQTNPSPLEIVETCAALCGVIVAYYLIYERLYSMRALVFSRTLQEGTGVNLRKHYRLLVFIWAFLPWLGAVALYFWLGAPKEQNGLHSWAMIPIAMSWVISLGLCVVFLLHHYRERAHLARWIYGTVATLAIVGLLMSRLPPDAIVSIYRAIGPLASMGFGLLFLISILILLAVLSQRSGFPALTLVIFALVGSVLIPLPIGWTAALLAAVCLAIFVIAAVARLGAVACVAIILALTGIINYAELRRLQPVDPRPTVGAATLKAQFDSWIKRTKLAAGTGTAANADRATLAACASRLVGKPYPVFIIAASGGGIYAASAASMLLARLQDQDPCFAQHVFAISAVSGGAIGTAIFQAVEQSPPGASTSANATKGCLPPSADQNKGDSELEMEVCSIIQDDHFSPLVASIFPEVLGFTSNGRAQELAASFDRSVRLRNPAAAKILDESFDKYAADWSKDGTSPAPILNATWVESGYRVAFAPFPLHAIDGTLYSFVDQSMPDDQNTTLLNAAVVSARFPAVLPPYSVLIRKDLFQSVGGAQTTTPATESDTTVRWNFVDGGYSDTTGAATALALYKALSPAAKTDGVVLRVILLTSSDPQLKPGDINGTAFADTLGPIDAMLSVRDGLGNEAVARACDGILGASAACSESTGGDLSSATHSPLQIVGIEDQNYGLSLGWKISQTTFGVVSWMLGEPQFARGNICKGGPSGTPATQANGQFTLNEKVVCANSRVQDDILRSLK